MEKLAQLKCLPASFDMHRWGRKGENVYAWTHKQAESFQYSVHAPGNKGLSGKREADWRSR